MTATAPRKATAAEVVCCVPHVLRIQRSTELQDLLLTMTPNNLRGCRRFTERFVPDESKHKLHAIGETFDQAINYSMLWLVDQECKTNGIDKVKVAEKAGYKKSCGLTNALTRAKDWESRYSKAMATGLFADQVIDAYTDVVFAFRYCVEWVKRFVIEGRSIKHILDLEPVPEHKYDFLHATGFNDVDYALMRDIDYLHGNLPQHLRTNRRYSPAWYQEVVQEYLPAFFITAHGLRHK